MSISSNIQAVTKTADAAAISGRTRVNGIYYTCSATASSFSLKNGAAAGATALVTINTPAAAGAYDIIVPDMGILFSDGVFIDVADVNVLSVTLLFEGGAAA
jgi:hypothetical protein